MTPMADEIKIEGKMADRLGRVVVDRQSQAQQGIEQAMLGDL